jgi:hypothetical protein
MFECFVMEFPLVAEVVPCKGLLIGPGVHSLMSSISELLDRWTTFRQAAPGCIRHANAWQIKDGSEATAAA